MNFRLLLRFFISSIIIFSVNFCNANNKTTDLYPIKPKLYHGHETEVDAEGGDPLQIENVHASNFIKDNSGIDYSIKSALGGTWDNAWCVGGNGIGEWIKADIPSNQLGYKGMMNVYRISLVNGLAKNENLYYANNRIKTIEIEFSGGEKRILHLYDGILELQRFKINIKSKWIKLTICGTYKGKKYNDTCIGKIFFETWEHPKDVKK
jgi:hypothetical protein